MDQKKIGSFLKELRKEKGLTQEQLAELMYVSDRTVSRWETGSNLPSLDILIRISDYYNVELSEILDGERKSGKMNKELEETVLKVADYSNDEKTPYFFMDRSCKLSYLPGFGCNRPCRPGNYGSHSFLLQRTGFGDVNYRRALYE